MTDYSQDAFEMISNLLHNPDKEALELSIDNCHAKGLFSLVIKGTQFGSLKRVFIAKRKIKPLDVQLHNHRYGIKITPIKGIVRHHMAFESDDGGLIKHYKYKSPLNGGNGLTYYRTRSYKVEDYYMPVGMTCTLISTDIHTVSCSKGSMWIVEEQGFDREESDVLGVPFITDDLYSTPRSFQINDNAGLVLSAVRKIINIEGFQ